tara:strand:- start:631 stop:864 length:234 start_codon:yes stop_codon:yes gene_type:complete
LTVDQLTKFLIEIKNNKTLFSEVSKVATANEIAEIAKQFGFEFTGEELKSFANKKLNGIKIMKQDTSPSYSFGENGN